MLALLQLYNVITVVDSRHFGARLTRLGGLWAPRILGDRCPLKFGSNKVAFQASYPQCECRKRRAGAPKRRSRSPPACLQASGSSGRAWTERRHARWGRQYPGSPGTPHVTAAVPTPHGGSHACLCRVLNSNKPALVLERGTGTRAGALPRDYLTWEGLCHERNLDHWSARCRLRAELWRTSDCCLEWKPSCVSLYAHPFSMGSCLFSVLHKCIHITPYVIRTTMFLLTAPKLPCTFLCTVLFTSGSLTVSFLSENSKEILRILVGESLQRLKPTYARSALRVLSWFLATSFFQVEEGVWQHWGLFVISWSVPESTGCFNYF